MDARALAVPQVCHGQPNIYALFMAQAARLLKSGGQLISITPRSFASGEYFRRFREHFFAQMRPDRLHLFARRDRAFSDDRVLQESVIARFVKSPAHPSSMVGISSSEGVADMGAGESLLLPLGRLLDPRTVAKALHMPVSAADVAALQRLEQYGCTLRALGCQVTTGPVVAFRCQHFMGPEPGPGHVPLLWLHNVKRGEVRWPVPQKAKAQYFADTPASRKLLTGSGWCVLVRRFSAKEESARVVAAAFDAEQLGTDWVAVENHLNVVALPDVRRTEATAAALAAYLNSSAVDDYVRIVNGNTQIGAADLLNLPCPDWEQLLASCAAGVRHG